MRIFDLTGKDLKQLARDWKSVTFLVAMPILFTLLFGFAFQGTGGAEDGRLPVAVIDRDGSAVSQQLLAMIEASTAVRPVLPDEGDVADVEAQVGDEKLAAAVIVPEGLGRAALTQRSDGGALPRLEVIANEMSPAGSAAASAVRAVAARLAGAVQAARLSAEVYEARGAVADEPFLQEALAAAVAAWQEPPLAVESRTSAAIVADEDERSQASSFAHSSAGTMVQFAMAGIMGAAEILVVERKTGALRRLLTTAIARGQIILGHWLAMVVMILAQLALLILFADLVLGVGYLRQPLATLLMVSTTVLWAASMGLFIGTVARNEEQVIMITILAMLLLAGLGGAWIPLEYTGEAFQTVGRLTPAAWAINGLENIVVRGLGLASVLLPAAVLLGFSAAFAGLALWRFRFE